MEYGKNPKSPFEIYWPLDIVSIDSQQYECHMGRFPVFIFRIQVLKRFTLKDTRIFEIRFRSPWISNASITWFFTIMFYQKGFKFLEEKLCLRWMYMDFKCFHSLIFKESYFYTILWPRAIYTRKVKTQYDISWLKKELSMVHGTLHIFLGIKLFCLSR